MAEKKKMPGYVPLTCHGLENPRLHHKPIQPYHKYMDLDKRIRECEKSFGIKKPVDKGKGIGYNEGSHKEAGKE